MSRLGGERRQFGMSEITVAGSTGVIGRRRGDAYSREAQP